MFGSLLVINYFTISIIIIIISSSSRRTDRWVHVQQNAGL